MKKTICLVQIVVWVTFLTSLGVQGQPYYLRGDFNGYSAANPMTNNGSGFYSATVTGGTPGTVFGFDVSTLDWSGIWPSTTSRGVFDATGSFTATFQPGTFADGWNPTSNRVGYQDPGQFGWEIMSGINAWSTPITAMTSLGNGLYTGQYTFTTAATYEFKFREVGSWLVAIGADFGFYGGRFGAASLTTSSQNETIQFTLDLPNGRWQTASLSIPEPGALGLLAAGVGMLLLGARRKRA